MSEEIQQEEEKTEITIYDSILDKTIENDSDIYRPYTAFLGVGTLEDDQGNQQDITVCTIYISDEIIEPFQYNDLFNLIRNVSKRVQCINLQVASPGGDIHTLCNLINAIEDAKRNCAVITTSSGGVFSAGAILALVGDYCEFKEFSYLMFHNLSLSCRQDKEHLKLKKSLDNMQILYKKLLTKYGSKILTEEEIDDILYKDAEIYLDYDELCERYESYVKRNEA